MLRTPVRLRLRVLVQRHIVAIATCTYVCVRAKLGKDASLSLTNDCDLFVRVKGPQGCYVLPSTSVSLRKCAGPDPEAQHACIKLKKNNPTEGILLSTRY